MQDNPFAAPESNLSFEQNRQNDSDIDRDTLRQIASAQRGTNLAALFYILVLVLSPFSVGLVQALPFISLLLPIALLGIVIFGAISVYRLAAILRGRFVAVIYVFGLMVPFIGLLLLLSVNSKATRILRANGIKVGFLGADPLSI
jgi:hypothetical protein